MKEERYSLVHGSGLNQFEESTIVDNEIEEEVSPEDVIKILNRYDSIEKRELIKNHEYYLLQEKAMENYHLTGGIVCKSNIRLDDNQELIKENTKMPQLKNVITIDKSAMPFVLEALKIKNIDPDKVGAITKDKVYGKDLGSMIQLLEDKPGLFKE